VALQDHRRYVYFPPLWLSKTHLPRYWSGFTSAADLLAYAMVTRLMWQTKNKKFLTHESELDFNDDLEYEYDENSISETYKFTHANYRSKHTYDNHSCDNAIKA